jgi:hypothetical protein
MTGTEATAYHLVGFEVDCERHRLAQARAHLARIDRRLLFPNQIHWLRTRQRALDAPAREPTPGLSQGNRVGS